MDGFSGESALVIPAPAAEAAFHRLRRRLDPSARAGIPAHITVLYPFLPAEALSAAMLEVLVAIFQSAVAVPYRLGAVRSFGDRVLFLEPIPSEPFCRLTERVTAAFPDYPPYEGAFDEIVPHLTVAEGAPRWRMWTARRVLERRLPLHEEAAEVWLMAAATSDGAWRCARCFTLGPGPEGGGPGGEGASPVH